MIEFLRRPLGTPQVFIDQSHELLGCDHRQQLAGVFQADRTYERIEQHDVERTHGGHERGLVE